MAPADKELGVESYAHKLFVFDRNDAEIALHVSARLKAFIFFFDELRLKSLNGTVQFGTWHQVVVLCDQGIYSCFFDVVEIGEFRQQGDVSEVRHVAIGGRPVRQLAGTTDFNGLIDEVTFFNRALTTAEVQLLFETPGYVSQMLGATQKSELTKSDIAHHYGFDGDFRDTVGNADGVPVGNVSLSQKMLFGSSSMDVRAGPDLNALSIERAADSMSSKTLSISLWFYVDPADESLGAEAEAPRLFSMDGPFHDDDVSCFVATDSDEKWIQTNVQTNIYRSPKKSVNFHKWHHLVFVRDNSKFLTYLDGESAGSLDFDVASFRFTSVTIGGYDGIGRGHVKRRDFNGLIDEVTLFNRALTTDEVSLLFKTPGYVSKMLGPIEKSELIKSDIAHHWGFDGDLDDSIGAADGTSNGNAASDGKPLTGKASLQVNAGEGLNAVVIEQQIPTLTEKDYSISLWCYPFDLTTDLSREAIYPQLFTAEDVPNDVGLRLGIESLTGRAYAHPSGTGNRLLSERGLIQFDAWNHVAFVKTPSESQIYVNGQFSDRGFGRSILTDFNQVVIGGTTVNLPGDESANDRDFNGFIDEVTFFNRSLTPSEVQRLATDPTLVQRMINPGVVEPDEQRMRSEFATEQTSRSNQSAESFVVPDFFELEILHQIKTQDPTTIRDFSLEEDRDSNGRGYRDGKFWVEPPGSFASTAWNYGLMMDGFVEFTGRATKGTSGGWLVNLSNVRILKGICITVGVDGKITYSSNIFQKQDHIRPIVIARVNPDQATQTSTIGVAVSKRAFRVFWNGEPITDVIEVDYDLTPTTVSIGATSKVRAEFDKVAIWQKAAP